VSRREPRKANKPADTQRHTAIRVLLSLLALAAIAFGCLILIWPAPFKSTTDSTKTTTEAAKTTTITESTTSSPSNALVGGVLGVGVLLLLAAALFERLQEIKGPAGTGIVLAPLPAPSEEDKRAIATLVPAALRAKTGAEPSPEETALATVDAVAAAQSRLWKMSVLHSDLKPENIAIGSPTMIGPINLHFRSKLSEDEIREAVGEAVGVEPLDEGRGDG